MTYPLSVFRIQPQFEDENRTTVSGKIGGSVDLDCNIFMLQGHTVSLVIFLSFTVFETICQIFVTFEIVRPILSKSN